MSLRVSEHMPGSPPLGRFKIKLHGSPFLPHPNSTQTLLTLESEKGEAPMGGGPASASDIVLWLCSLSQRHTLKFLTSDSVFGIATVVRDTLVPSPWYAQPGTQLLGSWRRAPSGEQTHSLRHGGGWQEQARGCHSVKDRCHLGTKGPGRPPCGCSE